MIQRCTKCGSYALNLDRQGIDQGGLCDVHYWRGKYEALKEGHTGLLDATKAMLYHDDNLIRPEFMPLNLREQARAEIKKAESLCQ